MDWAAFALAVEFSAGGAYKEKDRRATLERNFNSIRASIPSKPFHLRL